MLKVKATWFDWRPRKRLLANDCCRACVVCPFFLSLVHHEYHRLERVRGWGRTLPRLIQDIILWHKVDVLALFETRVSGDRADKVLGCLGFEQWVKVDVVGFSGGLWVLWNECVVHVDVLHVHP